MVLEKMVLNSLHPFHSSAPSREGSGVLSRVAGQGSLPAAELPGYLPGAEVVEIPSNYPETLGCRYAVAATENTPTPWQHGDAEASS
jgi:hypothetical protein